MDERDLPQGTANDTPMSFNDGVDAISNLFDAPAKPDRENEDEAMEAEADAVEEDAEGDEPEAEAETEDAEANAEEEGDVDAEAEDGSDAEIKGGRFAPDTAKVTLDDGTVITVGELRRNNLYQRDYTRKTTELKELRKQFDADRQQVDQTAQQIAQQRDFLLKAAQALLPTPPDPTLRGVDPIGYMEAKDAYEERMRVLNGLAQQQNAHTGHLTQQQQQEALRHRQQEAARLVEVMPDLREPANYQRFWGEAVETMQSYGFTAQEVSEAMDHRFYLVMRDAIEFRKSKAKAKQVRQDIQAKPKLLTNKRRMDPKEKTSREAKATSEALRKTGSMDAGINALMAFDL